MLCTSNNMDDVLFSNDGLYGGMLLSLQQGHCSVMHKLMPLPRLGDFFVQRALGAQSALHLHHCLAKNVI